MKHVWILVSVLVLAAPAVAEVLYVDNAAPPLGDGANWSTAFRYLQDALAVAVTDDEIRIGPGTYKPDQSEYGHATSGDRAASFTLRSFVLRGGYAGLDGADPNEWDPAVHVTALSGDLLGNDKPAFGNRGDNSYHICRRPATGGEAFLEGVTIRAGYANSGTPANASGAGIWVYASSMHMVACRFEDNWSSSSGPAILSEGELTVVSSRFAQNRANWGFGGAVCLFSNATFLYCEFAGNYAYARGGAVHANPPPTTRLLVANSVYTGNVSVYADADYPDQWGGGALAIDGSAELVSCTFSANDAQQGYGDSVHGGSSSQCVLRNCAYYGGNYSLGTLTIDHSQSVSAANFVDFDGLDNLVGTSDDDLRLAAGSSCIDAGTNIDPIRDLYDLDADGCTTEPAPFDLAGLTRYVDDPATLDTGAGAPPVIDIGAYEFGGALVPPPGVCTGDTTCDGVVDFGDINPFVLALGNPALFEQYYPNCALAHADINNDGIVGFGDINPFVALLTE